MRRRAHGHWDFGRRGLVSSTMARARCLDWRKCVGIYGEEEDSLKVENHIEMFVPPRGVWNGTCCYVMLCVAGCDLFSLQSRCTSFQDSINAGHFAQLFAGGQALELIWPWRSFPRH